MARKTSGLNEDGGSRDRAGRTSATEAGARSDCGPDGGGRDVGPVVLARALRVLLVAPQAAAATLSQRLEGRVARVTRIDQWREGARAELADALGAVGARRHDVALVHADAGASGGLEIVRALAELAEAPACVVIAERPTTEFAIGAMRAGAADLVASCATGRELAERLAWAARRARAQQLASRRLERRCARLASASEELDTTGKALDRALKAMGVRSGAHEATPLRVERLAMAGELSATLRQELELEGLLRTLLECMLKKTGPTNAAVFLPSSAGDFTLGAYANYDCPKDCAETMLDTLAGVVAPAFERRPGLHHLASPSQVGAMLGEHAHWLPESAMLVTPCRVDDECLAVLALFRDAREGFSPEVIARVGVIAELLAQQLARVVRTHHRHMPKHTWASPGDVGLDMDMEPDGGGDGAMFGDGADGLSGLGGSGLGGLGGGAPDADEQKGPGRHGGRNQSDRREGRDRGDALDRDLDDDLDMAA